MCGIGNLIDTFLCLIITISTNPRKMTIKFYQFVVVFFSCGDIQVDRMIDLKVYKQVLVKNRINNLSEEEILKLRDQQDQMADIFFNMWVDITKKDKIEI